MPILASIAVVLAVVVEMGTCVRPSNYNATASVMVMCSLSAHCGCCLRIVVVVCALWLLSAHGGFFSPAG